MPDAELQGGRLHERRLSHGRGWTVYGRCPLPYFQGFLRHANTTQGSSINDGIRMPDDTYVN
jgi:hypothetical protein